jgi:hypothetical protein
MERASNLKTRRRAPQLLTPCAVSLRAPKRVPNLLGALLFSMSETGRKCFQLGPSNPTIPDRAWITKQRSIGLGGS